MAWYAYSDHQTDWHGWQKPANEVLLSVGTVQVQVRINDCPNGTSILRVADTTPWARAIELRVNNAGLIELRIASGDNQIITITNGFTNPAGAKDLLVTYAWDARMRSGRLTVSDTLDFNGITVSIDNPPPLFRVDLLRLAAQVPAAPVACVALSDRCEPVGPMPGISPLALIDTPNGPRPAGELTTGDLICTEAGKQTVLARTNYTMPATGIFAPALLHAPFHGLKQSMYMARHQQLLFDGVDVEYDLGQQSIPISAGHLTREVMQPKPDLITYCQFLLPVPVGICAQGACLASVNIGRLRRNRVELALSLFGNLPEELLPDHGSYASRSLPDHTFRMHTEGHHF